ncbi:MAG: hypothetical protein QMD61_02395 [Methanobacterium sp.]|nr:hypothetical protein [Methanobacterium sp.]
MRDIRFIAEHLGEHIRKEKHCQLMNWACDCAEHMLHRSYSIIKYPVRFLN